MNIGRAVNLCKTCYGKTLEIRSEFGNPHLRSYLEKRRDEIAEEAIQCLGQLIEGREACYSCGYRKPAIADWWLKLDK